MKLLFFSLLFSSSLWSRSIVLLGHFDAFGNAPFNSSERVAKHLFKKLKDHPDVDLRICSLETIFDKSFYQLEDCYKNLEESPALIIGLGESNCNFKIETMGRNFDKTFGPDNDGIERNNTPIKNEGPDVLGFKYPLPEMYCSLTSGDRSQIEVSNNAGAFVCNNLAYQFAFTYPEVIFGFIHVPANNCRNLEAKTEKSVMNLERMILAAIKVKNVSKLMTGKKDIELLREANKDNKCLDEFYRRTKGVDEKGFWTFLGSR